MSKPKDAKDWLKRVADRHGNNTPATPPQQTVNMPAETVPAPRTQTVNMPAESVPRPNVPVVNMDPVNVRGNAPGPSANAMAGGASGNRANPPAAGSPPAANASGNQAPAAGSLTPGKFKLTLSQQATLAKDRRVGPCLMLREWKSQAQAELEVTWNATSNQSVNVNALERQVGQEFENSLTGVFSPRGLGSMEIKEKHGWSASPSGREIGIGVECEFIESGSVEVKFNPAEISQEGGMGIGVIHVVTQLNVTRLLGAFREQLTGTIQTLLRSLPFPGPSPEVKLKITGGFDFAFQPNWTEIASRMPQLGAAAATIALPLLVGAAHGAMFLAAARSGERTAEAALWAQTYARGYIRGYTQTMTGQTEPSGNGPGYAGGFSHGQQDGNRQLATLRGQGHTETSIHNAASRNYDELRTRVFQTIRDHCIHAGIEMAGAMNLPMQPRVIEAAVDHERP